MANSTAVTIQPKNFNNNSALPDISNKSGEDIVASMWGLDKGKIQQVKNISKAYFSKHGMFAAIPIICRGADCVYKDVCMVDPVERTVGARCPMEISAILTRFEQWCDHFNIDTTGDTIATKDLVDASLIKDLVNVEVQILRAENKIALSGDFMAETLLDIDKKCKPYYGSIVSPEAEYLMALQDKKIKILNQLNATRKDKAADKGKETASDEAVRIFQQLKEMSKEEAKKENIIDADIMDAEFDDEGNVIGTLVEQEEAEKEKDDSNGNKES